MDRKEFLLRCGTGCLALSGIILGSSACSGGKHVNTSISNNTVNILKAEFDKGKPGSGKYYRHIIIRVPELSFPIVVYRRSDSDYKALLLRCSHQQAELSVNGDVLSCSAHNSEFNNDGAVIQGPAEEKLTSFKVQQQQNSIIIQLA